MSEILIDTRGLADLQNLLRKLPQSVKDRVIDEVTKYLVNVLRENAPYRYVSRKAAYGRTFVSDKQRRWFFAALMSGELNIPYRRTQTLSRGWKQVGSGETSFIANETPYAKWVVGDGTQSRHEAMVGWKQVTDTLRERESQINRRGEAAAQNAIRKADQ